MITTKKNTECHIAADLNMIISYVLLHVKRSLKSLPLLILSRITFTFSPNAALKAGKSRKLVQTVLTKALKLTFKRAKLSRF